MKIFSCCNSEKLHTHTAQLAKRINRTGASVYDLLFAICVDKWQHWKHRAV